ncbi:lipid carrier--UDP-N-acetylgalactosaminyltransferase [bacterium]|nr:lipid carrier--UDP-N-acetylgalactosaminyltransferase [bacterium]
MYRLFFKRIFDILISLLVLVIVSPLFILTIVLLLFQNNGKPFFYQSRPGKNHKEFKIIKFKSMNDKRGADGKLLPDIERMTPLGKFVRKLSIDELPQLFNVLKGEMSLIGPRPLLFKYIELYSPEQNRRHEVMPGITGLAQVKGRNSISWAEKFEYDIFYVNNLSLWLDIKILVLTFLKVIKTEGVNQSDTRPMEPFDGTN